MALRIQPFKEITNAHYQLLLTADPSREVIETYLARSICLEATVENQLAGVLILLPTRPETLEIVNLAVLDSFQDQGIAQQLINHAIAFAKKSTYKTLEVGTGSTSLKQLYLYQKCGFRMSCIDKDFFIRHYSEEIIENGLILKDMVRLTMDL